MAERLRPSHLSEWRDRAEKHSKSELRTSHLKTRRLGHSFAPWRCWRVRPVPWPRFHQSDAAFTRDEPGSSPRYYPPPCAYRAASGAEGQAEASPLGLMPLAFLRLHLEVGGEDVLALLNQSAKVGAVAFDGHLNAICLNVLPIYELDASPHGRDMRILEPNPESGGMHCLHPGGTRRRW